MKNNIDEKAEMIKEKEKELVEYKFKYHLNDNQEIGEKFYVARTLREAVEDFEHTCSKRRLTPNQLDISRWDRWRGEWEKVG